ncbi:MAG: M42 family metallopeptidase [Sarcina sp.]
MKTRFEDDYIDLSILANLCDADGIAGCEKEVSRVMKSQMEDYVDEISYDNLGSIIGFKKGKEGSPKIMMTGHMDEVGFIVRGILENGYLVLLPIGGWWVHALVSQELVVTTSKGEKFKGIVVGRAPHGMSKDEKEKVLDNTKIYLDLGVESREEVLEFGISIGDMVTPNTKFEVMNNKNYLMGKAFDDRMACGIIVEVLKKLNKIGHDANIYGAGTVQEEVGIRGARTLTHKIKPDLAIAIDVTTSEDTPLDDKKKGLGGGVVLTQVDSLTIGNQDMVERMKEICECEGIDYKVDFMMAGGTDACNIHKSFDGIPVLTVSIPTRYMHSHRLVIHKHDYMCAVKLITEFCRTIK